VSAHAVILAGGTGQRFWPLSRELSPKQLLSVFGTESLVAQAVHRVLPTVDEAGGNVLIVTNERLLDELRNNLSANDDGRLSEIAYLVEPVSRNTAPAIALAAVELQKQDPEAVMVVLPSDHLLDDGPLWQDVLNEALRVAGYGFFVTVGLTPTHAETGYGYVEAGKPLVGTPSGSPAVFHARQFVEKPDLQTAERFVAEGRHYWNAGIFVMRAADVLGEMRALGGDAAAIEAACRWVSEQPREAWLTDRVRERFASLPSAPFDKVLLEKTDRVAVVPANLPWHDVGSFLALESVGDTDGRGNTRVGRGVDIDTQGSIVYASGRLVATLGLTDTVVVDTADATLVCSKDRCQDVRLVVDALKALGAEEVVLPKTSLRPWGSWTSLLKGAGFQIKLLDIKSGCKPSLQRHDRRSEHWVVVEGEAVVTRDHEVLTIPANESVFLPVGCVHRVENRGSALLKIIEVQVGDYLGEDDIVRLEDDWHREGVL
jgi:mannose-1-phosphate guanylyltransferase / mannose-6-phosphate isomerase